MEEIGQKIRALRRERGFTLKQLASLANCSPSFISQVERGKASPSIATLKQIASALKVNIVDFFLSSDGFEPVVMPRDERVEITL
ncbi:MAG: transcriptional regulator, partial [Deltaproteobacteria bacterium]